MLLLATELSLPLGYELTIEFHVRARPFLEYKARVVRHGACWWGYRYNSINRVATFMKQNMPQ